MTPEIIKILGYMMAGALFIIVAIGIYDMLNLTDSEDIPEDQRKREDGFRVGDRGKTREGMLFEIKEDLRETNDPRLKYFLVVEIIHEFGVETEFVNRDGLVDEYLQSDNDLIWESLNV